MPSKNDLSVLKTQSKNTLVEVKNNAKEITPVKAGRKPKPVALKQSELIGLRFTLSELETIKEKAGLIPVATYLKDLLAKQTTIFCENEDDYQD